MYKIKSSFADCLTCDLLEAYSCILETNAKTFDEVEVIFIAENPGKTEVEHDPPVPLVGKAGQIFRKYFKHFSIDKAKYLLTNVVLCQTLLKDGKTGNPTDDVIQRCKVNCFEIVKKCNPKLIVLMGASPAKAFELLKKGDQITKVRGNMYKWNDYDILLTFHPSYVGRNRDEESKFEADIKRAAEIIGTIKTSSKKVAIEEIKEGSSGIFHYRIPDKYYTSDYKLVDVQYLNKTNEVLYIFRDKDNNKIYHKENDLFVCYKNPDPTNIRPVMPYEKLNQIKIPYRNRSTLDHSYYESDVKITVKHCQDYYLQKKEDEPNIPINTLFLDIETLQTGEEFSTVDEANDIIAMIGFWYHGKHLTYVLDPDVAFKGKNVKKPTEECVIFKTERELVAKFINDLKQLDPDVVTGWYCLGENESVWLEDRIQKIKNCKIGEELSNGDKILNKVFTGNKKQNQINLVHGFKINCSDDHIFPVFVKDKNSYITPKKVIDNIKDLSISDIKKCINDDKEVYFTIDKRNNTNPDYTYRQLLVENLDKFLSFDLFDIAIIDDNIFNTIRKNKKIKDEITTIQDYWWGKGWKNNNIFTYKKLQKYITKQEIVKQLINFDMQDIIIGNRRIKININETISSSDLELLGFTYTDGFWTNYGSKPFCYDQKDYNVTLKYMNIINENYMSKSKLIPENKVNKRDNLYTFEFSSRKRFSLLSLLIYNGKIKKELDLQILSRLSFKQVVSFFNGLIDGDGSCLGKNIQIACYTNNGKDNLALQELLLWNGIVSYIEGLHSGFGTGIYIPSIQFNSNFISSLNIIHSERKAKFENGKIKETKNSCSNIVDKFIVDNQIIVKLKNIDELEEIPMYDIKTTSGYFTSSCGIKTHNCDGFDIPYIINRCKKLGINAQTMSKFGEVEIEYATGRVHITGFIVLDLLFLYQMYTYVRQESYTLDFIGNLELGEGKLGKGYNFSKMFFNDPDEAIRYNHQDVAILPKLDMKLKHIGFQNEIRKVCKCDFNSSRSSLGQLDSLIVSFLKEKGLSSKASEMTKKDVKFEGAFVKEPLKGIHDYLVDLDATSLYPSTIITYNLGLNTFVMKFDDFTLGYPLAYDMNNLPDNFDVIIDPTFEKRKVNITKEQLINKIKDEDLIFTINGCFLKNHSKEKSFYSEILEFLLQSRKIYKKKMFESKQSGDEEQRQLFDTRQMAMKILANSLYGILGNDVYRFFNTDLARAITLGGQELLKNCIASCENYIKSLKGEEYEEPQILTKQEIYTENFNRDCEHIITCDTDSLFVTFGDFVDKKKSDDEIIKDISELTEKVHVFINSVIIPKIINKHNIAPDFNKLEFKNELVMKRGLFLAKKRYAVHVVSQEGVKCDDTVIKGIEVRRSDFPSYTKERLKELIEIILKSKYFSYPKIMDFVKKHEKEFISLINSRTITIARPVSFTKKVEEYKVLSQGVKGMLNYNMLEHEIFGKGSKAYLFKLKGIDLELAPKEVRDKFEKHFTSKGKKLDEIAIPEVLGNLPPYYVIDVKGMLKFSWIDRYSLLLEPMTPVSVLQTF